MPAGSAGVSGVPGDLLVPVGPPWPGGEALLRLQTALGCATPEPFAAGGETTVGGVFVCFPRGETGVGAAGDRGWAGAASVRGTEIVGQATVRGVAGAPYVPGQLAAREGPLLEAAARALPALPEVLLVNATGRDHPRRAGLALQLGWVLDRPTVGVTHRPLYADGDPPRECRGATSKLVLGGDSVGAWLVVRAGARPLAVHPGWRTDLETAIEIVLSVTEGARTPRPLRAARQLARAARALDEGRAPGPSGPPLGAGH